MHESIKTKLNRTANTLPLDVLQRKNTVALARWLIGKTLARRLADGSVRRHIITETEAYHSESDLACHASKGRTPRTEVLYRAGGIWYVYLCYGIHEMLNLVSGPAGHPAAILIRAVNDISGPGRVTKTLSINRALNGLDACDEASGLWLEETPPAERRRAGVSKKYIRATPRIGIDYAGPVWSAKPWRFVVDEGTRKRKNNIGGRI